VQNKKIISTLGGSLAWMLALAVIGVLGSWFLFQKIAVEETDLKKAKDNYDVTLKQLQSFDSVKSDFEESMELKNEAENMMVKTDNILSLIEELEKAAQSSGVVLKTNVGEKPGTSKNFPKAAQAKAAANSNNNSEQEVWLQLEVNGSFANVLQFIRYLENAKKLISIASISINQSEKFGAEEFPVSGDELLGKLKTVILISNVF